MSEDLWYGWRRGNRPALHIGPLPGRKSICLYVVDGSVLHALAYFRTEEDARRCLALLDDLVGGAT